jgi:glycosyltransferase involved in cell wall biosynthesis
VKAQQRAAAPLFSVVIPLYNKRPFIRRALTSVLAQDFAEFELIVVDDGSTDGSAESLAELADPRLTILRQVNQGEGAARNAGMSIARGNWIALLDADDAWMPAHLSELARIAREQPAAGLISTRCVEATGDSISPAPVSGEPRLQVVDYFLQASRKVGFINATSTAVKAEVFRTLGGFSTARAGADLEYWARVALRYPVAVSERVTCVYFRDTGGVMSQLHAGRAAARPPPMKELKELSPSVAMLCATGASEPAIWSNPSIVAYVNGRLTAAIRAALVRGDMESARRLAGFFRAPTGRTAKGYALAARLPAGFAKFALSVYRTARRLRG